MKKEKELYDDSWIYILLSTTFAILIESLKTYTFKIKGVDIEYSIILIPLVFFINNYITKKYDYKKAISSIAISATTTICFVALISFAIGRSLVLSRIAGDFIAYVISSLVNLTIYYYLLNNTKSPILILINYMVSLIIFIMLYTIINLNTIILDNYWIKYFYILVIDLFINIILTVIDKSIKKTKS